MTSKNLKANKNAIILGSSKGIGNAFLKAAIESGYDCQEINSKTINTLDKKSVDKFIENNLSQNIDLFVFNTGGLPPIDINKDNNNFKDDFEVAFQTYFWSFYTLLSNLNFDKKAIIIYLSSHVVENIEPRLMASSIARASSEKLLENFSGLDDFKFKRCLSIRFGPVLTNRLLGLMQSAGTNEEELSFKLGMDRLSNTKDIFSLANLIIESSSLFGSGIYNFDSGIKLIKSLKSL